MKVILAALLALCCGISGTVSSIVVQSLGTNYIRTPQYDVAQVRNLRSGRAFAYSTVQHHAYQAVPTVVRPVVSIYPPIIPYSSFYPLGYSSFLPYYPSYVGGLGGFGGGFYPGFGAGGFYPGSSYQSSQFSSNTNDNVNVNVDNSASAVNSDTSGAGVNGGTPFSENSGGSTFSDTSGSESSFSENSEGTPFSENSQGFDEQQSQDEVSGPSGFDDSDSVAVDSERKK